MIELRRPRSLWEVPSWGGDPGGLRKQVCAQSFCNLCYVSGYSGEACSFLKGMEEEWIKETGEVGEGSGRNGGREN